MRVIAGASKGRRLFAPRGLYVRPTSDRVKQRIFDILPRELSGLSVLDLFAGTGSLGVEALSRGAQHAVFVDASKVCASIIVKNVRHCGFGSQARIITAPAIKAVSLLMAAGLSFHLALMDPPYGQGWSDQTLARLGESNILIRPSEIVVEHDSREKLLQSYGPFVLSDRRRVGQTWLSFYTWS